MSLDVTLLLLKQAIKLRIILVLSYNTGEKLNNTIQG